MQHKHTILVVDDEPDVVKSVKDLLRLDYNVLGATSALDGMQLLSEHEVHVVMTDQRMPEMTGVEFLSRIRGEHPEAVRLLFTGYADMRAVIDAINQGNVYRYITKPWDPDELQTIIREAAERYDLIVERKRLLAELQAKNAELEKANEELSRAGDLKTAFIRVATHELRTPLTILLGMTRLVMQQDQFEGESRDMLRRVIAAAERLQRLINQLIDMLEAGRYEVPLNRQSENLTRLVRQAIDDVRVFIDLRGQTLEEDLPDDLGAMRLDVSRIRDVLNHLLLNAVKFTPDGGSIRLSVRRTDDGGAEIEVSDTGVGIDSGCLRELFSPFFTGFNSLQHSSGHYEFGRRGLGLGLSVVKAFVEMHGGRISAESEPGRGATFRIRLPGDEG